MLKLSQVVVAVDPQQEHQPALDKVLTLARLDDFDITLLSVEYSQYLVEGYYFDAIDLPRLRQEFLDERRETLEAVAAPLREKGLSVSTLTAWGHPSYEVIVREAMRLEADLVIQHTRQHSSLSRLLLTHNDWQLVRCCPVPLLLVKEEPWKQVPHILAAVDPMHSRNKPAGLDHKILQIATDIAQLTQGEEFVIHSYNPSALIDRPSTEIRDEHQRAFDALLSSFDIPESHKFFNSEATEFALTETARDAEADMVVMGAISRSILSDVFIGNTTEKVLDFLTCDILIIKPDGFTPPIVSHG
ncbi:MAG TPA: universal stress protein [Pseudomonadales bacterium]|nr:universal stress protein [Pseudomonadales bacterium]